MALAPEAILQLPFHFWSCLAAGLWDMAESSHFAIGEFAPIWFGLMLGSPGQLVEEEPFHD